MSDSTLFCIASHCLPSYIPYVNSSDTHQWADIVFSHPPHQRFTYAIPDRLNDSLSVGQRVVVPLGKRKCTGFLVERTSRPEIEEVRDIEDIADPYPLLTTDMLKLTRWVSEYYLSPWGQVIRTCLPPGLRRKSKIIIHIENNLLIHEEALSEIQQTIIECLCEKRKTSLQSLQKHTGSQNIRYALNQLESKGIIRTEHVLEDVPVQPKIETWISLRREIDEEERRLLEKRAKKQAYTLSFLKRAGGEARRSDIDVDFAVIKRLIQKGYVDLWEEEVYRDAYKAVDVKVRKNIILTKSQRQALAKISKAVDERAFHTFLIHGVTASGKTQVYIEAIQHVLEAGHTALVLIPEIALTPQAVQRYRGSFGDKVAVLHSRMSAGERVDAWKALREGKCSIAVGPRSAVFAPLNNLGIIVVDEEHETSYKQADPAPRYHARDVAIIRGMHNDCPVILGSATPSLESYANAVQGKYTLLSLPERIDGTPLPRVSVVDMKDGKKVMGQPMFTPQLLEDIESRLDKGEQIILLQNRRGYAGFLRCATCGYVEDCPHCDISLTYHQKDRHLRCHYCGYQKAAIDACEACGGSAILYRGIGTQRVEEALQREFPKASILRMDQDTTRRKGAHDRILKDFEQGTGDILLGTQMVAKGHDFPKVSLVGIISADTGLYFPDFRSGERTFQLMTQAAGRAGRRKDQGKVIVQSATPDHPVLQFAADQDYRSYFEWESPQRRELTYPPWGRLILIRFIGPKEDAVNRASSRFREGMTARTVEILGPVPAPMARVKGNYRYQIICKIKKSADASVKELKQAVLSAMSLYRQKANIPDVRVNIDVDPVDLL